MKKGDFMKKKIRFGVRLSRVISTVSSRGYNINLTPYEHIYWPVIKDIIHECERLEYDSVMIPDHPMAGKSRFACWSTLSAIAAITDKIKIGTMTTNTMRYLPNPSLFAKEVATLDRISDGRLYPLALGIGYTPEAYKAYGFPFPSYGVRLRQLRETIEIMNRMFTGEQSSYSGKYFKIDKAICKPKPVQDPFPICLGGRGKGILKLAAEYADHMDLTSGYPPEFFRNKLNLLEKFCKKLGRDYDAIEKSWGCWFWIYADEKEKMKHKRAIKEVISRPQRSSNIIMGTPEELIELFQKYIDLGITYFTLRFEDLPSKRGLRLFSEEVMAKF